MAGMSKSPIVVVNIRLSFGLLFCTNAYIGTSLYNYFINMYFTELETKVRFTLYWKHVDVSRVCCFACYVL